LAVAARIWAVVPAAGIGARMGAPIPKQYLPLAGRPLLLHTLERLCRYERLRGVLVGLAPGDPHWEANCAAACARWPRFLGTYAGGTTRAQTVLNGLLALAARHAAADDDWVLVHDAARPCVRQADIDRLIEAVVSGGEDGGLLALPVTDTVKRADAGRHVLETVVRERLWRALTPQMFRLAPLARALEAALAAGVEVTDESSAMEATGARILLVEGSADNIKITLPQDLDLAERCLVEKEREGAANRTRL
jgi:2-C-methyl-D-erythritol 4-phosphate cytidylyltransferase